MDNVQQMEGDAEATPWTEDVSVHPRVVQSEAYSQARCVRNQKGHNEGYKVVDSEEDTERGEH